MSTVGDLLQKREQWLMEIAHMSDHQLSHRLEQEELRFADMCTEYVDMGEPVPPEPLKLRMYREAACLRLRSK